MWGDRKDQEGDEGGETDQTILFEKKMFLILKIEHASKLERMGFLVWGDSLVERMHATQH